MRKLAISKGTQVQIRLLGRRLPLELGHQAHLFILMHASLRTSEPGAYWSTTMLPPQRRSCSRLPNRQDERNNTLTASHRAGKVLAFAAKCAVSLHEPWDVHAERRAHQAL